jgi:hypothetical protein
LRLWSAATGNEVRLPEVLAAATGTPHFSPDGKTLATQGSWRDAKAGLRDETICFWEMTTGELRSRLQTEGVQLGTPVFTPDGTMLAALCNDNRIRIWNSATREVLGSLGGQEGTITSLGYTRDGKALITGTAVGTVLVWDVTGIDSKLPPAPAAPADPVVLWNDMAGRNAARAYRAILALAAEPSKTVPLLRAHVQPVPGGDADKIQALLADLDNDVFAVRQRATQTLRGMREVAAPFLRQKLVEKPSAEARRSIEAILHALEQPFARPAEVPGLRAVEVLERIGTPEARRLLGELAEGAPEARLTREAKASLERLAGRTAGK